MLLEARVEDDVTTNLATYIRPRVSSLTQPSFFAFSGDYLSHNEQLHQ